MSTVGFWSIFGYIFGAIPFDYMLGQLQARHDDIHTVGDGSPWMSIPRILKVLLTGGTHRRELNTPPHLRPWLPHPFERNGG